MIADRCSRAIEALQEKPNKEIKQSQEPQIVRTIVLSQEEDEAITSIKNKYNESSQYLEELNNYINNLNNITKENENKINKFRKESVNKLNLRMDQLIDKSRYEINKKKKEISNHIKKIKEYNLELINGQKKQTELLNDTKLDTIKRKIKIMEINKNINNDNDIIYNKKKFNPMISVDINEQKTWNFIQSIGNIDVHSYPEPPIFYVKQITTSSATV